MMTFVMSQTLVISNRLKAEGQALMALNLGMRTISNIEKIQKERKEKSFHFLMVGFQNTSISLTLQDQPGTSVMSFSV